MSEDTPYQPATEVATDQVNSATETASVPEILVPAGWTWLLHGSNLSKPKWQNGGADQLDSDTFVIKGMGLSVVTQEEIDHQQSQTDHLRARGIGTSGYNTTKGYASGSSLPIEIKVLFPSFHSREGKSVTKRAQLIAKYGEEKTKALFDLADVVYWRNHQSGRHPILPRGMRLIKLSDNSSDTSRQLQYIPEILLDFYHQEITK